jgi:hypothetical protein
VTEAETVGADNMEHVRVNDCLNGVSPKNVAIAHGCLFDETKSE